MAYTKSLIEVMRGIHIIACDYIIAIISSHKKCECLYQDIFELNGLVYNPETIKQKRIFVAAITQYFIMKRCNNIKIINDIYTCGKKPIYKKAIHKAIDQYFEIRNECKSNYDLMSKYAQLYNEDLRDFSEEIRINRDDILSDFAKSMEQVYNSKDDELS